MMRWIFALIFCLVSCCPSSVAVNPSRPVQEIITPVWIDRRFTDDQRDQIKAALHDWNYALNGYQEFRIENDKADPDDLLAFLTVQNQLEGLIVHWTYIGSAEEKEVDPEQGGVLAWVPEIGGNEMYLIMDRIGYRNLHTIVMHELGHILGAPHIRIAGSLMYPGYPLQRDCVDVATGGMVLEAHTKMHWSQLRGLCPL